MATQNEAKTEADLARRPLQAAGGALGRGDDRGGERKKARASFVVASDASGLESVVFESIVDASASPRNRSSGDEWNTTER